MMMLIEEMGNEIHEIRNNFVNFYNNIKCLERTPLTKSLENEVSEMVLRFLELNNLRINLYVNSVGDDIYIYVKTLQDQIVWESIQTYVEDYNNNKIITRLQQLLE